MKTVADVWRLSRLGVILILCALSASCGLSGKGKVKGTITVDGAKLPRGLITFQSEEGNKDVFSAAIIDGVYETDEIPTGMTKITIISSDTEVNPEQIKDQGDVLPTAQKVKKITANAVVVVPDRYHVVDTTPLSLEIKSGSNTFDADLTWQ